MGAINALIHLDCEEREQVVREFEQTWQDNSLVMDNWFSFQARSKIPNTLQKVRELMQHSSFTLHNPNKVRALIGAFAAQNAFHFHNPDGSGYEFIAQQVLALNDINPQVASRLARTLMRWKNYTDPCGKKMREQLEMLAAHKNLSKDVYEIVTKSL
jgi:aminopeptidase N